MNTSIEVPIQNLVPALNLHENVKITLNSVPTNDSDSKVPFISKPLDKAVKKPFQTTGNESENNSARINAIKPSLLQN